MYIISKFKDLKTLTNYVLLDFKSHRLCDESVIQRLVCWLRREEKDHSLAAVGSRADIDIVIFAQVSCQSNSILYIFYQ